MKINFSIPIYESIWSDEVDQLLAYDYNKREWTVKSLTTGKTRTHISAINIKATSLQPELYSTVGQDKIEQYLKSLGITHYLYY